MMISTVDTHTTLIATPTTVAAVVAAAIVVFPFPGVFNTTAVQVVLVHWVVNTSAIVVVVVLVHDVVAMIAAVVVQFPMPMYRMVCFKFLKLDL